MRRLVLVLGDDVIYDCHGVMAFTDICDQVCSIEGSVPLMFTPAIAERVAAAVSIVVP